MSPMESPNIFEHETSDFGQQWFDHVSSILAQKGAPVKKFKLLSLR